MIDQQPRLIAFYLPQYHPIPENDAWWGRGFTEWTNVVSARPLFAGHYQPHLPADLGFYDLRLPEARQAQADLAKAYGIHGFCYYHYWFNGRRLLQRPFNEVLASGKPDFPFCLCWANENWTRAWDGLERDILVGQKYNPDDDRQHLRWLATAFEDQRYIRIDGKPLFLVYRISTLPNPLQTASIWREEAHKMGLGDIFLAFVESLRDDRVDPTRLGFDAVVEFQPDWLSLPEPVFDLPENNRVFDYGAVVDNMNRRNQPPYKRFPCVTPGWDNSARRQQNAVILNNSTPERYQQWLETTLENLAHERPEENLIFINAWNEWAEGAHLEPCQKWGRAYLEATQKALESHRQPALQSTAGPVREDQRATATTEVSVCIPTYNGAKYLAEAITSILEQSWTEFELIIVDDCSDDETEAIVSSFDDRRIKFIKNPVRLGLVGNWNRCLELSGGRYICIFHQDDVMMPQNLAAKIKILAENPSVGMVYSNVWQIGPAGQVLSRWWYFKPDPEAPVVQPGPAVFEKLLAGVNIVCCPSAVIRRECYEKLGGFDPQLPFTADWEMWLRLALFYDIAFLPDGLVKYRRHDHNETLNFLDVQELEHAHRAKMRVLDKYPERTPNAPALKMKVTEAYKGQALERALKHYRQQELAKARQYLAYALDLDREISGYSSGSERVDWLFEIIETFKEKEETQESEAPRPAPTVSEPSGLPLKYRPVYQQVIQSLSGEDIARQIPIRRIIQAIAFKVGNQPGLGWLYTFRGMGKRILGGK